MAAARIICLGNPYQASDWVGPAVFAALRGSDLGPGVELVDGGLHGLNLLALLEGVARVVFVDTLVAADDADYVVPTVIAPPFAAGVAGGFDHGGGLAYLLRAAPLVLAALPRMWVVGAAAAAGRELVRPLADACLELARG
jgi:hydrogenase maturation protease